ncbi:hypothetical protein KCU65_g457, partial [Aureobasidium melanogenum]
LSVCGKSVVFCFALLLPYRSRIQHDSLSFYRHQRSQKPRKQICLSMLSIDHWNLNAVDAATWAVARTSLMRREERA